MGMSASQARFLSLTARKNNVEFEGQQINQQRTCLSNESASYYSELCNMAVPAPPCIDDYTKVSYSFNDGAMTNTIMSILPDKNDKTKYLISYVQQWQDDYAIVPSATSMVLKDGSDYKIGNQKLRALGTAPAAGIDKYYDSLSAEEKSKLIETEKYYVALLQDKIGDSEKFHVRYVKNDSTGVYEPQFFADSELTNSSKYNNKSLASVPCYTLGSVTQSKEVIGQSGIVEKDSSGRYVAISFEGGTTTQRVKKTNTDEINAWEVANPKPNKNDATYNIHKTDARLANIFDHATRSYNESTGTYAAYSCYNEAINGNTGCYMHILQHCIDYDGTATGYPKTMALTTIPTYEINIANPGGYIHSAESVSDMTQVADALKNGYNITLDDGTTTRVTLMAGDRTATSSDSEKDKLLSDFYIKNGSPTDLQILMSNYFINDDGEIEKKTLLQKAKDLYYICQNPGLNATTEALTEALTEFQNNMTDFSVFLSEKYQNDLADWYSNKPAFHEEWVDEEVTIANKTYSLVATTTTDEEAYNDAMNQYNYEQHEYEHKIQEINSKLEIIQQQDKMLELKIKQLDTEENAINTELDAVKKVISKNVDASFKTFG